MPKKSRASSDTNIFEMVVDIGNGSTNYAIRQLYPDSASKIAYGSFASLIGSYNDVHRGLEGNTTSNVFALDKSSKYVYGEAANNHALPGTLRSTRGMMRYTLEEGSDYYLLLAAALHDALKRYAADVANSMAPDMVVVEQLIFSLPLSRFNYERNPANEHPLHKQLRSKMLQFDCYNGAQLSVLIKKADICPEGIGAAIAFAEQNKDFNLAMKTAGIAVLDIGYQTAQLITMQAGAYKPELSETEEAGGWGNALSRIKNSLETSKLAKRLGVIDESYLDLSLRSDPPNAVHVTPNAVVDISQIYTAQVNTQVSIIMGMVVKTNQPPSAVLISGGGSLHIAKPLAERLSTIWADAQIFIATEEPWMLNIRGLANLFLKKS